MQKSLPQEFEAAVKSRAGQFLIELLSARERHQIEALR